MHGPDSRLSSGQGPVTLVNLAFWRSLGRADAAAQERAVAKHLCRRRCGRNAGPQDRSRSFVPSHVCRREHYPRHQEQAPQGIHPFHDQFLDRADSGIGKSLTLLLPLPLMPRIGPSFSARLTLWDRETTCRILEMEKTTSLSRSKCPTRRCTRLKLGSCWVQSRSTTRMTLLSRAWRFDDRGEFN
jgi:hypothetical protein